MRIVPRKLAGTFEVSLEPHRDERGYFMRWYDAISFERAGLPTQWVQANESGSKRGVVRGLHFQRPPHAEAKFVRALKGRVYDVFVDLRRGSATYGEWDALELSAEECNAILIPRGFAHGFCALTEEVTVSYLVDNAHAPDAEGGLLWSDPRLAIPWPVSDPIVSAKDRDWPPLSRIEPIA